MLDPVIDFLKAALAWLVALPGRTARACADFFKIPPRMRADGTVRKARHVLWLGKMAVIWSVFFYAAPLVYYASWTWGHDLNYPQTVLKPTTLKSAEETTNVEDGTADTRTCGRSQLVDMEIALITFMVDDNAWMESLPQYKFGFFGIPWSAGPILDNKASFQFGVLAAVRRSSVELADVLGRLRGTSEMDKDLQNARGAMQYDSETWWFNPFDDSRPFGPVQPTPYSYRKAKSLLGAYNDKLVACKAVFDARADNLRSYLDRAANDLGSTADGLSKRSTAWRYDPATHTFVGGEGNSRGWFDFRADNLFWESSGQLYAYHGLVQAVRSDFETVIKARGLTDLWNRLERNLAEGAALDPLIVSNGSRDGFIMPDHLAVMAEAVLRSRAVMQEISDVLDR